MGKVSITLPSIYPRPLLRTLNNIRNATYDDYEVIVISPFQVSAPNVKWLREEEPRGAAYAHSRAAQIAEGEFLLGFSDDFMLVDGWDITAKRDLAAYEKSWRSALGVVGLRFVNNPNIGTVYGKYYANFPFMSAASVRHVGWIGEDYQEGFGDGDLSMRIWEAGGWCEPSTRPLLVCHSDDARKSGPRYTEHDLELFVSRWAAKFGAGWDSTHLRGFNLDIPFHDAPLIAAPHIQAEVAKGESS